MSSTAGEASTRSIFGVPMALTSAECSTLISDLAALWAACYARPISDLESDIECCLHFFNPVARGQSLRDRLSRLAPAPADAVERIAGYGPPLVINAGEGALLVGIEARLVIDLLTNHRTDRGHVVVPETAVSATEHRALQTYRRWAMGRLEQVIELRTGRGKEPLQLIAVGIVLALLVNRSTDPSRAVIQRDHEIPDGKHVDTAIYASADAFAASLSPSRRGRSSSEHKLKGGYAFSEARRRLAHRLTISDSGAPDQKLIFIPAAYVEDVIALLGAELARRSFLTEAKLQQAFDELAATFRAKAEALAYRSMAFDRKPETNDLKQRLLDSFSKARSQAGQSW